MWQSFATPSRRRSGRSRRQPRSNPAWWAWHNEKGIERGAPALPAVPVGVRVARPLNVISFGEKTHFRARLNGRDVDINIGALGNTPTVLAAANRLTPPVVNVVVARLLGAQRASQIPIDRLDPDGVIDRALYAQKAKDGFRVMVTEAIADDYVPLSALASQTAKLPRRMTAREWQGLVDTIDFYHKQGIGLTI